MDLACASTKSVKVNWYSWSLCFTLTLVHLSPVREHHTGENTSSDGENQLKGKSTELDEVVPMTCK